MSRNRVNCADTLARIALVRLAASSGLSNCFDWIDSEVALRVSGDPANQGFTAITIRQLAQAWIVGGGEIREWVENRENWIHRREFWYSITVNIDGFPRGEFVEMELVDNDPEFPVVALLNAHPQVRGPIIWTQ
jgi:hypothetical protein